MMSSLKKIIDRRQFIRKFGNTLAYFLIFKDFSGLFNFKNKKKNVNLKEAMFYKRLKDNRVGCLICFRGCIIKEGKRGFCRNKENREGRYFNLVYGKPSAVHVDPVEKEPCFHLLPGSNILCFGTAGCNFRCKFCHNWHLSQRSIEDMEYTYSLSPKEAVEIAVKEEIPTISFTYNEPTSFYEYAYEIAKIAKEKGLRILWHSNGGMNPKPLRELLKYTDAVTIDLKGFTQEFYSKISSSRLKPVLRTLKIIRREGKWLEIVNLHIPTLNDNHKDIKNMCLWIKENLGTYTPLHFTRFFPSYKLKNLPPTPIEKLERAYYIAKEVGLKFVYIGNTPGHIYNSTFCPNCQKRLIHRYHFSILENNIRDGRCKFCNQHIEGIWS
jgi:pyruvate formate lyase activating enzyme